MWVQEVLDKNLSAWLANPSSFFVAIALGLVLGFLLSGLRHKGRIDALDERLKGKDDVIAFKDQAIKSLTSSPLLANTASAIVTPIGTVRESQSKADQLLVGAAKSPFAQVNDVIVQKLERAIREIVAGNKFHLTFDPLTGRGKTITFLPNGVIGEGRNHNEHAWRIAGGRLELLEEGGAVHSRFILLSDGKSFHHTNEADTKSLKGQYIELISSAGQIGR
jgi:hypothetical protein